MKVKLVVLSMMTAAVLSTPLLSRADDNDKGLGEPKEYKSERGNHFSGTVSSKTADAIVVGGKTIKVTADTKFAPKGSLASINVGDKVHGTTKMEGTDLVAVMINNGPDRRPVRGEGEKDRDLNRDNDLNRDKDKDLR